MRKCKLLFGLVFAILTLCVLSIGASASTDSPYDVYVSDVPVTPENAADILGDGTASYDAEQDLLRLNGYTDRGCSQITTTTSEILYFSIYCNGNTDIEIVGEGNYFQDAVYTKGGNIMVRNASVTFPGTSFGFLLAEAGDMLLKDSRILVTSVGNVTNRAFSARNLVLQSTELILETDRPSSYPDSFLYASREISVTDSKVRAHMQYPLFLHIFQSAKATFTNSEVGVSSANYVFYVPSGELKLTDCKVEVTKTRSLSFCALLTVENTEIDAQLYYSGIRAAYSDDYAKVTLEDSNVRLTRLPFSDMAASTLAPIWAAMEEEDRQKHGTYESFLAYFEREIYRTATEIGYGLAYYSGDLYLSRSTFVSEGFAYGIYGQYGVTFSVDRHCRIDLTAEKGALLLFLESPSAVSLTNRNRVSRATLSHVTASELLSTSGEYLYGASTGKLSVSADGSEGTEREILDTVQGLSTELVLRTAPYVEGWVVLLIVGGVSVALLSVGAVLIVRESKRKAR